MSSIWNNYYIGIVAGGIFILIILPYSHQISPPLNFRPPGGRKLKGANWEPKLGEGRKLKGTNWAPKIGGAKIKGSGLVTENRRERKLN